jgi:uncharacterized ion transporter superfamily protein YfcC
MYCSPGKKLNNEKQCNVIGNVHLFFTLFIPLQQLVNIQRHVCSQRYNIASQLSEICTTIILNSALNYALVRVKFGGNS